MFGTRDLIEEVDVKLLGVFSTQERADGRSCRQDLGFRDYPDNFEVSEYILDEDTWTTGYVTLAHGE